MRGFITEHIDSVEQLEVLLLLRRTAGREWSPEAVSDELRTSPGSAGERLADLVARGLVETTGERSPARYRYHPRSHALARAVDALADAYAVRQVTIISLIFSKPIDKIRSFADAFRLRRDEPRRDESSNG